ncbi:hypothetical protein PIB30_021407 [Stylosanthes scabra]|uniref:Myb/SANT-like domain-containing protein n=1 Tax=Stylosanthes scabra TaxID=79078 RepID=A0ABU6T8K6_9FABA|nr:hypothetical protein [Stylosanthes scabra]
MKTLNDHFFEAYDLFHNLSGFAWNPVTRKFEAEEEVWQDFVWEKPHADKWKRMQIKHYDTLKELFGVDKATGKRATTSRERIQLDRDPINLNESFENMEFPDVEVNIGHDTPTFSPNLDSQSIPHNQPKTYEKVALGINTMDNAIKEGNYISNKLKDMAEQQVAMTRRQVEFAKRQATVAERQVSVAEKQVSLIESQVAIAEKG